MIQNFMAEAAISMQSPPGGLISEEYNPYLEHAPFYASASSDASGHVRLSAMLQAPARDHGEVYGTDYGFLDSTG